MTAEIAVLGAGNMGTALAQVAGNNGHNVRLWSIEHDVLEEVRDHHRNTRYLDGIHLHPNITAVWELADAVRNATLVIISVPSQVVRSVSKELFELIVPGQLVLNVAKGLEADTHLRMSQVICQELGRACTPYVGSMGGPAIAIEMARGGPLAVIIGITDEDGCETVQKLLQNSHLKIETTRDVDGLELCSTLKNVYAIVLGMCDGLRYGTNTKAFFASLALNEMCDIAMELGGMRETVYGLAGLGDLLTTGFSDHSRNRTLGEHLGGGTDWEHFLRTNTVEGFGAARSIKEITSGGHVHTHLLDMLMDVLYEGRPAPAAMRQFFENFTFGD